VAAASIFEFGVLAGEVGEGLPNEQRLVLGRFDQVGEVVEAPALAEEGVCG
jgi:hypothetical protein